jgi:hypothetical protein
VAKTYGKLPHEVLMQPYGTFLIDTMIYSLGSSDQKMEILKAGGDDMFKVIVSALLEL